jgi:hypothetical protein
MGFNGKKGDTGCIGPTGCSGPTGSPGTHGQRGYRGVTGCTGPTGPCGEDGLKGDRGLKGTLGDTGPIGPTGPTGEQGLRGYQGLRGLEGPTGESGSCSCTCTKGIEDFVVEKIIEVKTTPGHINLGGVVPTELDISGEKLENYPTINGTNAFQPFFPVNIQSIEPFTIRALIKNNYEESISFDIIQLDPNGTIIGTVEKSDNLIKPGTDLITFNVVPNPDVIYPKTYVLAISEKTSNTEWYYISN